MKHADKDRDPEKARKRARADARCALRKLDLLDQVEHFARLDSLPADEASRSPHDLSVRALMLAREIAEALS